MDAGELYKDLGDKERELLERLAGEITEKYQRGPMAGQYQGRVILFLGAASNYQAPNGLSCYTEGDRPPLGKELGNLYIEDLLKNKPDRICEWKKENFPLSWITQYYEEADSDRRRLITKLLEFIDNKKVSPILKALARMPFKFIISTNYDTLFEEALTSLPEPKEFFKGIYKPNKYGVPEYTFDPGEAASCEKPFVFKLHGDIKDTFNSNGGYRPTKDAIVLTDEDYLHFILRMSQNSDHKEIYDVEETSAPSYYPIPQSIYKAFTGSNQNTFLFVGYGLKDYNLRLIFKTALWQKDSSILKAVQKWSIDSRPDEGIKNFFVSNYKLTFIERDIWCAIPYLYKLIFKEEMPLD